LSLVVQLENVPQAVMLDVLARVAALIE